jgi:hypothetical protein
VSRIAAYIQSQQREVLACLFVVVRTSISQHFISRFDRFSELFSYLDIFTNDQMPNSTRPDLEAILISCAQVCDKMLGLGLLTV